MASFVYVDNSNVWIEGQHVRAVEEGLAPNIWEALTKDICAKWSMDFGRLLVFAGGPKVGIGRAVLYGSRPPPNDSLWKAAEAHGFEVVVHDRNVAGKEKKVDTNVVADVITDSYEKMTPGTDEIVLVAGDGDYVPAVEKLIDRGFEVHLVFWNHASGELKKACTSFTSLNPQLAHLSL